ncbi:hypothetical protein L6164_008606 [Bauhinia variegata]|uniref:Uncharacterized protein n=1 Tax=Bauhinia variegata TaxID=167791 RepID=A0ACB9PH55_BAUVA|nr:hypothetical protein L6164_008606 [Bauhinia variegata]
MDSSALVSKTTSSNGKGQKGRLTYEHCKKVGHTRDTCWDIHGKPTDWKPQKGKPKGYQATQEPSLGQSDSIGTEISPEQIGHILKMLSAFQKTDQVKEPSSTASMAHKGNYVFLTTQNNRWIVDFGASNHMTSDSMHFHTYFPSAGHERITTANGSSSSIARKVSIVLSKNF